MKFPWKANEGETLIFFYGEDIVHVVFRLLYVEYSSMNYNYYALSCYLINIISHYFSCTSAAVACKIESCCADRICGKHIKTVPCPSVCSSVPGPSRARQQQHCAAAGDAHRRLCGACKLRKFWSGCKEVQHRVDQKRGHKLKTIILSNLN